MTTIAVRIRDGVGTIAADSRVSDEFGAPLFRTSKLERVGKSIFGVSGDDWVDLFMKWIRAGQGDMPETLMTLHAEDVDFAALELAPDGIWYWNRTFTRQKVKDKMLAIGSGADVARYAMKYQGFDPPRAVFAASLVDNYTDGHIDTETVKQES